MYLMCSSNYGNFYVGAGNQTEDKSDESDSNVVLIGIVVAILLLVLIALVIVMIVCVSRRRKRRRTPPASPAPPVAFENNGAYTVFCSYVIVYVHSRNCVVYIEAHAVII